MAEAQQRGNVSESETEVWNAITAFEKILEVMPDDRSSLETLSHAYEHIGDRVRALDYLLRLGEVLAEEGDQEAGQSVIEKLRSYGDGDARIEPVIAKLSALEQSPEEVIEETPAAEDSQPPSRKFSRRFAFKVTDELSFAWKLFEVGEISQEDYAGIAHDLAELSVDAHLSTISVLHVLENKAFSGMERVMGFVSHDARTPIITLQSFELHEAATGLLPYEFTVRRGALVFDMIKDEALVAVMNPYDRELRAHVLELTGKTCHFFIALPQDFDAAVGMLSGA